MAYIQTCVGGYSNPCRAGRYEVCGVRAAVDDVTAASRIMMWDDSTIKGSDKCGKVYMTTDGPGALVKVKIADVKGLANGDGYIDITFPEPIKTRYGISVYTNNIVSVELYVR